MSVVVTARPLTEAGQKEPQELELTLRGRAWLCIPNEGDNLELADGHWFRVARRRFRLGGDVELVLRADHMTRGELEAMGFSSGR